jgi:nitrogen regulatory protein PII
MKMIWAVVRSTQVKAIAQALKEIGASGCTVYPVRGYGEEWHVYEPLIHGGHHKIEVIVEDDRVDRVVSGITDHASTGLQGDGLLSVFGLDRVVHLRSGTALT